MTAPTVTKVTGKEVFQVGSRFTTLAAEQATLASLQAQLANVTESINARITAQTDLIAALNAAQ